MISYLAEAFGDRATNGDKNMIEFFKNEASRLE